MSTVDDPSESPQQPGPPPISAAAEAARERLHEEIERVRVGVEQMLGEQEGGGDPALRRELDALREEMRKYVKRRVRKVEKRLRGSMREIDERTSALERRFEAFEQERRYAEWRIHTNTEAMLDGLLREVRAIGDLLTRMR
jgi:acyl carrier protein phosphodiesterase